MIEYKHEKRGSCMFSGQYWVDDDGRLCIDDAEIPFPFLVKGVVEYRGSVFILSVEGDLWRDDYLVTDIPKVLAIYYTYEKVTFITTDGYIRSYGEGKYKVEGVFLG